jgi:hypothetical protein
MLCIEEETKLKPTHNEREKVLFSRTDPRVRKAEEYSLRAIAAEPKYGKQLYNGHLKHVYFITIYGYISNIIVLSRLVLVIQIRAVFGKVRRSGDSGRLLFDGTRSGSEQRRLFALLRKFLV